MKVIGLDGKQYSWNPIGSKDISRETSSYHANARKILKDLYPTENILEEVALSGTKPTLYADLVICTRKLVVEAHGEQHYKWIPYFHATKRDFINGQKRDRDKRSWCELNNYYYIELPYSETLDEWRRRILSFGEESS